jgi:TatD DNase family protein
VEPLLTVGTDLASSCAAIALTQRFATVFAAVGVHPHEAARFRAEAEHVRELLGGEKVVAVGEIGLDYGRDDGSRHAQMEAFVTQLAWARERGVPASVHNRAADDDVLTSISRSGATAILHCFSGSQSFAERALEAGCYLSFAGNLTFPRAEEIRRLAANVPIERLLVESDAPVLAPQPRRGRRNEPAFVRYTAQTLATLRGLPLEELASRLASTARSLLAWGTP